MESDAEDAAVGPALAAASAPTSGPGTRSAGPPTVLSPTKLRLLEQNLGGKVTFADGSLRTVTNELRKAWVQRSIPGKVNKVIQDWAPQQRIPRGLEERVAVLHEVLCNAP